MRLKLILAGLLLLTAAPVFAQVVPQATDRVMPFYVGGGYSRYSPDWGPGRTLDGMNLYAGLTLPRISKIPAGLGVEAEWHSLFFNPSVNLPNFVLSETTMGGGVIYKYQHWQKFRPYAKYFLESGKNHYGAHPDVYATDLVTVMGGGIEYKVKSHYWIRADYSRQTWSNLFKLNKDSNPQGVTLGMTYNFQR
jgi:hypothetical protein